MPSASRREKENKRMNDEKDARADGIVEEIPEESAEQAREQAGEQSPEAQAAAADAAEAGAEPEEETAAEAGQPAETAESKEEEELQMRYLRLAADFQNFRKRVEKEKQDVFQFANEKIMSDLLSVIDNFDRALETPENWQDQGMLEGMQLILKQLKEVVEKNGLEEIKALGEPFDPNFHHAVMMEQTDEYESGTVSAVLQKGYLLNTRVIRPAMVKVAE